MPMKSLSSVGIERRKSPYELLPRLGVLGGREGLRHTTRPAEAVARAVADCAGYVR